MPKNNAKNKSITKTPHLSIIAILGVILVVGGNTAFVQAETMLSPLKQFKSGIPISNIQCVQDLSLVIKAEDGTPACVKQDSISKLILRGWISTTSSLDQNNTIFGYFYQGIENNSEIVSIKNQTYYMMTATNATYPVASGMTVKFHQVTFSFPYGSQATPGGVLIPFDMTFPDGTTEAYGKITKNPDGSGSGSGIGLGPGPSSNRTVTVQSDHIHPQAGVTLTEDQIKLLVSTDVNSSGTPTQTFNSSILRFYLSTNSTIVRPNHTISIDIGLDNTSPSTLTASSQNNWPLEGLSLAPCLFAEPYGISLLQGNYYHENMTEARQLSIYQNGTYNCPMIMYTTVNTYVFQPSSDKALLETGNGNFSGEMTYHLSIDGFYGDNGFEPFTDGTYTIVGGDEWGDLAIQHFVVTEQHPTTIYNQTNSKPMSVTDVIQNIDSLYNKTISVYGYYTWKYPYPLPMCASYFNPNAVPKYHDSSYVPSTSGTHYLSNVTRLSGDTLEIRIIDPQTNTIFSSPAYDWGKFVTLDGTLLKQYVPPRCGDSSDLYKSAYLLVNPKG